MSSKYGNDIFNDEDSLNDDEARSLYGDIDEYWTDHVSDLFDDENSFYGVVDDDNIEEF